MRRLKWLSGLILFLACFLRPGAVRAQAPEGRTEVSILVGVSLLDVNVESPGPYYLRGYPVPPPEPVPVPDPGPIPIPFDYGQRDSLGGSFVQGFKVGRYVSDRAVVELGFVVAPTHHLRSEAFFTCPPELPCPLGGSDVKVPIYQGRELLAAYHYGLGLGYDLARGDVRPFLTFGVGGVSYDTNERVRTHFAFNFGAGAKLYFGKVGARIEAQDEVVTNHFLTGRTEHDIQVRGGLVFRLP